MVVIAQARGVKSHRTRCVAAAVAVWLGAIGDVSADRPSVLFAPTYGDSDLRDHAGAVSLLVRGALDPNGSGVVAPYVLTREGVAPTLENGREVMASASARYLIVSEVDRKGIHLTASAHVLNAAGTIVAKAYASAPEGAVAELATKLSQPIAEAIGRTAAKIPDVSVGQLRPYIRAELFFGGKKSAEAAEALAAADPLVGLRVASAGQLARAVAADTTLSLADRLTAIATTGVPRDVLSLSGSDASPAARAHRALASVEATDAAQARRELADDGKSANADPATDPVSQLARAALARLEHQGEARDAAITAMLAAPTPMQLRWLSRLAPASLSPKLEQSLLNAATQTPHLRLASILGLRAAEAGIDVDNALALVTVTELDAAERARLTAILPRATGFQANRLNCELAVHSGNIQAARTAAAKLAQSDRPQSALCRGRIAWQLGYLGVAATDLARGNSPFDAARVLLSAGDPRAATLALKATGEAGAQTRIEYLTTAALAQAEGRAADAKLLLQKASVVAPGSWIVHARLADILEQTGDLRGAAAAKARIATMASPEVATAAPAQATVATMAPGSAAPVARTSTLAASSATLLKTLRSLFDGFPPELFEQRGVVVARYGDESGWWRPRTVDNDAFENHVAQALRDLPKDTRVVGVGTPQPMPPRAEALAELATAHNAATVVLYRVRASGAIRLMAFDAATRAAAEIDGSIDPGDAGLLRWNYLVIGPLALLLVTLVGWLLWVVIRGNGVVEVHMKMDPSGTDEVLCVELVPSHVRPEIGEPEKFIKLHRSEGQKVTANRVTLANSITKFRAPAGPYWVHVWGVYQRAGNQQLVDDAESYSKEIKVTRGSKQRVNFDLAPTNAELRIRVLDEKPAGIALWLDDSTAKAYTNDQGAVTIYARLGTHTLHINSDGLHIEREIALGYARIERMEFNLVRERRLADVTGGLSLKASAAETAAVARPKLDEAEYDSAPRPLGGGVNPDAPTLPLSGARAGFAGPEAIAAGSAPAVPSAGFAIPFTTTATSPAFAAPHTAQMPQARATAGIAGLEMHDPAATDVRSPPLVSTPAMPGVGSVLMGRYKIGHVLGEGAMGVVFRATDQNLEREVAIKVMSRELRSNPDAMRFFVEEAKALAQLNHSNIVSVFDQLTNGDETYLIMEFVDGRTVDAILRERNRLPIRAALALIDQLCTGLAYVHGRRIIHRDIKPANIFVSKEKVVKLGDFGLARVMRELSIRRTEIRGTPLYMAPEQITGQNVTHRIDLYAVGCTLFELVTGRPPFIDGEIMIHHLTTAPPVPSSLEPSVPPEVDELILACLEKEPDIRVESANAIRDRIRAISQVN